MRTHLSTTIIYYMFVLYVMTLLPLIYSTSNRADKSHALGVRLIHLASISRLRICKYRAYTYLHIYIYICLG